MTSNDSYGFVLWWCCSLQMFTWLINRRFDRTSIAVIVLRVLRLGLPTIQWDFFEISPRRWNRIKCLLSTSAWARTKPPRTKVENWPVNTPSSSKCPIFIWIDAWSFEVISLFVAEHFLGMYRFMFWPSSFCIFALCLQLHRKSGNVKDERSCHKIHLV